MKIEIENLGNRCRVKSKNFEFEYTRHFFNSLSSSHIQVFEIEGKKTAIDLLTGEILLQDNSLIFIGESLYIRGNDRKIEFKDFNHKTIHTSLRKAKSSLFFKGGSEFPRSEGFSMHDFSMNWLAYILNSVDYVKIYKKDKILIYKDKELILENDRDFEDSGALTKKNCPIVKEMFQNNKSVIHNLKSKEKIEAYSISFRDDYPFIIVKEDFLSSCRLIDYNFKTRLNKEYSSIEFCSELQPDPNENSPLCIECIDLSDRKEYYATDSGGSYLTRVKDIKEAEKVFKQRIIKRLKKNF